MLDFINGLIARAMLVKERDEGQTLVEYALILALVSIVSMGTLALLGGEINNVLKDVKDAI